MHIAIIDAEIVGKTKHRFPNLCSMKLSSYHKSLGDNVELKTDYDDLEVYDKVYISKVFTKTVVPEQVLQMPNVQYGGTGFFYDKALPLPPEIEHTNPDYHLYDEWIEHSIASGAKQFEFDYYLNYSIGYLTRGCFRGCSFCVNRNCRKVVEASPLNEFYDETRSKICLLDDNFFGYPHWKELIAPVINTGKRFQFKQGLDERLLTTDKILEMSKWKYDGEMIFAFDNIKDKDLIISKLELIRKTVPEWKREMKFYTFCGYDENDLYDEAFWKQDIENLFERISILSRYNVNPYVMRYEKVYDSEYSTFYSAIASWCNQPSMFKTFTFRKYAQCRGMNPADYKKYKRDTDSYLADGKNKGASWRQMEEIEKRYPDIAAKYYDFIGRSFVSKSQSERRPHGT